MSMKRLVALSPQAIRPAGSALRGALGPGGLGRIPPMCEVGAGLL